MPSLKCAHCKLWLHFWRLLSSYLFMGYYIRGCWKEEHLQPNPNHEERKPCKRKKSYYIGGWKVGFGVLKWTWNKKKKKNRWSVSVQFRILVWRKEGVSLEFIMDMPGRRKIRIRLAQVGWVKYDSTWLWPSPSQMGLVLKHGWAQIWSGAEPCGMKPWTVCRIVRSLLGIS